MINSLSKFTNPTADAATRITERADLNKDGRVTRSEFKAVFEAQAVPVQTTPDRRGQTSIAAESSREATVRADAAAKAVADALAAAGINATVRRSVR